MITVIIRTQGADIRVKNVIDWRLNENLLVFGVGLTGKKIRVFEAPRSVVDHIRIEKQEVT